MRNLQILFKSRPNGMPSADTFELVERELPPLADGEVLCRTVHLSVDPYMRGRMNPGKSYVAPAKLGEPMVGQAVSQVVESKNPRFAPGDYVLGFTGWQSHSVSDGRDFRKLDRSLAPLSYFLGVLGMPGLTAYVGVVDIGQPKEGETVVVSAAAGAVGSAAGQIAKLRGARVVGTAGTDEKCAWVTGELRFDACINYKREDLHDALKAACPNGIDVYIDNVGGAVLEAVLERINVHARIVLIGMISQYNSENPAPGPNLGPILVNRATLRGMVVIDHSDRLPDFLRDMSRWLGEGKIHVREDFVDGLENAPEALFGLFRGENIGKRIVRVAPEVLP